MDQLNILNGECLKEYLGNDLKGVICFNECLVDGRLHKDIFSEEFFAIRAREINKLYSIGEEEYLIKTKEELKPLLTKTYDEIILWFDRDMFCQINLLTLLAYLEQKHYRGHIKVNLIRYDYWKIADKNQSVELQQEIKLEGMFKMLYQDILIEQKYESMSKVSYINLFEELDWMKDGIRLYVQYHMQDNEIKTFIKERIEWEEKELIKALFEEFSEYGLGDMQYINLIHKIKVANN